MRITDDPGGRPEVQAWRSVPRPAWPILRELVIHGPQSRTALARKVGLSGASLTRLTKPLVESGLIAERDIAYDPVNGRPTRPLEVVADSLRFLGVKITADRVFAVVTNLRADVVAEDEVALTGLAPTTVVAQIGELADALVARTGPPVAAGITLGGDAHTPAALDETELVDSGRLGWERVPIRRLIGERLGIPCVVKNDVTALAYSHQWFGAARGVSDFAVVAIGAGIGYALVLHDREVRATEADIGEFGHQILDPSGPACAIGHRGCASAYATTRSVLRAAGQGLRRSPSYPEVLRLAEAGDPVCSAVVREAAWALGMMIGNVANSTMVKTVIVAGEGGDAARVARADLERGVAARRRDYASLAILTQPHHFTDWARGAAVAAIRSYVEGTD
ncbi:ROK family transcriptional regulator [Streptomyces sp. NBRC 109706]|uniref:ROK family transcriptional regulator n=1 Tax=Streptomyces sp. NBRC 109706 TaxID=1550035 RepID=UPI0007840E69|nr:ROK family transcriptional regulator [Streptomyces sp. NBRC 109706]